MTKVRRSKSKRRGGERLLDYPDLTGKTVEEARKMGEQEGSYYNTVYVPSRDDAPKLERASGKLQEAYYDGFYAKYHGPHIMVGYNSHSERSSPSEYNSKKSVEKLAASQVSKSAEKDSDDSDDEVAPEFKRLPGGRKTRKTRKHKKHTKKTRKHRK